MCFGGTGGRVELPVSATERPIESTAIERPESASIAECPEASMEAMRLREPSVL